MIRVPQAIAMFLCFFALMTLVQAQFFTKTSKSIPRMGRRADSSLLSVRDPIESVSDQGEYWPSASSTESPTARPNPAGWARFFTTLFHLPRSWFGTQMKVSH